MIEAVDLTKRFGQNLAVDSVSLSIPKGQIFGLLGPNAAGKTTLIRMLCGILKADGGHLSIDDKTGLLAKSHYGYVAQYFGQYEELTVWENLKFYAQMYNVTDTAHLEQLLSRYQLDTFKHRPAGKLSGGYQRRLALVCAVAHDPEVLFLDEPTAGIDPVTRKILWDEFYRLSGEGKTLFVTTHYMEEAQRCHQLAFISSGKIVARGTPSSIISALGDVDVYATHLSYQPELREELSQLEGMVLLNQFGDELRLVVRASLSQQELASRISNITGQASDLDKTTANLEDVFIALTQSRAD
ncbi:ABC transporter ATP-binding protein [Kangiella shandongensis]|uniref:ABC transporter ATP-binding protein n=1 Tax=Kangiella shandongensis TaxID=2763258 RepID=UPI001CBEC0A5|nr:ABC transporter ATP-binding protein [Kangiella shandongensis]